MLYECLSAFTAIIVFLAWIKPAIFRVLIDKDSSEPSLGRQGQFTAMVTSTWIAVTLTIGEGAGQILTEWFMGLYMLAWAGAGFSSIWLKLKGAPQPGTTIEKQATTTTETTKVAA